MAAQVLSSSVAKALQYMRECKQHGFEDSRATQSFIEVVDRLFDILNVRNNNATNYKAAMTSENFDEIQSCIDFASRMILSLKDGDGDVIVNTRKSTGFVGFLICGQSYLNLSRDLLSNGYRYVLSYKFSQDHLELFFNAVRRSCGWNDNPTAIQMRYIMRRFLAHAGVESSTTGNCQLPPDELNDVLEESPSDFDVLSTCHLSPYVSNVSVYIAGFVVRKMLRTETCPDCRLELIASSSNATSSTHFLRLKDHGGLLVPSNDIVKVVQTTKQVIRTLPKKDTSPSNIVPKVLAELVSETVFSSLHFLQSGHRYNILKTAVSNYSKIRSFHICKSRNSLTSSRRFVLHKLIHFGND